MRNFWRHSSFTALLLSLGFSLPAQGAKLAAFCTMSESGQIQGEHTQKRLPIASVSKMMTTWWSLAQGGADYRFVTKIHLSPSSPDGLDLHLEGSRDPYFGRESLHFLISELNRRGIRKIRRLSFDENFKFYVNVTSNQVAASHYVTSSPQPTTVLAQLRSMGSLTHGWSQTLAKARRQNLPLVAQPKFQVQSLEFQPSSEFQRLSSTQTFQFQSAPLLDLLKEMNRNSNNHAANQIFEHFGGAENFRHFVWNSDLKAAPDQVQMLNGSGDRVDLESGPAYNEASCELVLKTLKSLRTRLRLQGKDLQHIMALSGGDPSSTVSKLYQNDQTSYSLLGKTGTVNPAITLAGLLHTEQGEVYFMYNFSTRGSNSDWNSARRAIRQKVTDLIRSYNGGKPISYRAIEFLSVDGKSLFASDGMEDDDLRFLILDPPVPTPRPPLPGESLP